MSARLLRSRGTLTVSVQQIADLWLLPGDSSCTSEPRPDLLWRTTRCVVKSSQVNMQGESSQHVRRANMLGESSQHVRRVKSTCKASQVNMFFFFSLPPPPLRLVVVKAFSLRQVHTRIPDRLVGEAGGGGGRKRNSTFFSSSSFLFCFFVVFCFLIVLY